MAKKKTKAKPKAQGSEKKPQNGVVHGVLTTVLTILVVFLVFSGAFYFVLKNDVYGLGEQFRPQFSKSPILKIMLPPLPPEEDPEDPKHLTQRELLDRYDELRDTRNDLNDQIDNLKSRIDELEGERDEWDELKREAEELSAENDEVLKKIEERQKELEEISKTVASQVARNDTSGFKAFFEQLDKEAAEAIYKEIMIEEAVSEEAKKIAKTYEGMEPESAATILEELGTTDIELVVDLLVVMRANVKAEIMQAMNPVFAADITKRLSDRILIN